MGFKVVMHADAGSSVGLGHVVRSSALAEAFLSRGADLHFVTPYRGEILERLIPRGLKPIHQTYPEVMKTLSSNAAVAVFDGYHFEAQNISRYQSAGTKIVIIDDILGESCSLADIILNQNLGSTAEDYQRFSCQTVLTGTDYCLIRSQFLDCVGRYSPTGGRILLTLGGMDTTRSLPQALHAFMDLTMETPIDVLVSSSCRHLNEIEKMANQRKKQITLHCDPENPAEVISHAAFAVTAAGSTCWELCVLGIPFFTVIAADNQKSVSIELSRRNLADGMGSVHMLDWKHVVNTVKTALANREGLRMKSHHLMELVDGHGADRVVQKILDRREDERRRA